MSIDDWMDEHWEVEDWPIRCDCCGQTYPSSKMVAEEGDRWECFDCWERLNAKEREEARTYEQNRDRK